MPLAFLFLSVTGLSSATIRFTVILRDRVKSDLATLSDSILDIIFQTLMDNVIIGIVVIVLISALFSIFRVVLTIYLRYLREDRRYRLYYVYT
ncbi:hypothetical protein PITC_094740 [Penicillium italicum]|uniref:Uncharacterized protein n=1 Tax=Penicillium italicum TaxID=40296 RepID=A0A0A2KY50_PENIT|nr:hypothetical protein PITC_094740 [Penicillium italicum]